MARETWTDERLDDLKGQVEKGFARVDSDIRELRSDVKGLQSEMNSRFDSMQRTMIIGFVTLFASIVTSVIGGVFAAMALV